MITYNIKSENEGQKTENAYATLADKKPDVICLQEDKKTTHNAIITKDADYKALNTGGNDDYYNAILYNSKKLTVVSNGIVKYSDVKNQYSDNSAVAAADFSMDREGRFFRWAILEFLDENGNGTGNKVLVVNTHLHYREGAKNEWPDYYDNNPNSTDNKAVRVAQVTILKLWLSKQTLKKQIVVGDMNCHVTSNEFKTFTSGEGALDAARDDALLKGDIGGTLTSNYKSRDNAENGGYIFDHVLYSGDNVVAAEYRVIDNSYDCDPPYPSDHLPVYSKFFCYAE